MPFVVDGLDAGEAVMVASSPNTLGWVRNDAGAPGKRGLFRRHGRARPQPRADHPRLAGLPRQLVGPGRPARGIGEPIWLGRSPAEIVEAQLHEALLNLAVDPRLPFWLVCPYDAEHTDPEVLAEVGRSHPVISTPGSYEGSPSYGGQAHAQALFSADLPPLARPTTDVWVSARSLPEAAERVTLQAAASDLRSDAVLELTAAVGDLVTDRVRRGAPRVRLQLWDEPGTLVCGVADRTVVDDFLVGRRQPAAGHRDPLWEANQTFDLVQVRSGSRGTSVRLHRRT